MIRLYKHSNDIISRAERQFKRFVFSEIDTGSGLRGIIGSQAAGRTDLLLQLMKSAVKNDRKVLYLDLSDPVFSVNSFHSVVKEFYRIGGEALYADNIQRYWNAGNELIEMSENLADLEIIYSGSFFPVGDEELSLKEKSIIHYLPGLSYREFIEYRHNFSFPVIQLDELLELNRNPGSVVLNRIRPMEYFKEYLESGYYLNDSDSSVDNQDKLLSMIDSMIDSDLSAAWNLDNISTVKIRRLLMKLSAGGLFRPNIEKLAREIGTTRDSLLKFIIYAERAGLIRICYPDSSKKSGKPQLLILDNPNLVSSLCAESITEEQLYETFLINQLSFRHEITMPGEDRLVIDGSYSFQMSWKAHRAGKNAPDPDYIIDPGIEYQTGSRLPLWMFGFLY